MMGGARRRERQGRDERGDAEQQPSTATSMEQGEDGRKGISEGERGEGFGVCAVGCVPLVKPWESE